MEVLRFYGLTPCELREIQLWTRYFVGYIYIYIYTQSQSGTQDFVEELSG